MLRDEKNGLDWQTNSRVFKIRCLLFIAVLTLIMTVYWLQPDEMDNALISVKLELDIQLQGNSTDNQKHILEEKNSEHSTSTETIVNANVIRKNLMFIKTHKCGTSTLVDMFYLFGVRRRWNFVMTPGYNRGHLLHLGTKDRE